MFFSFNKTVYRVLSISARDKKNIFQSQVQIGRERGSQLGDIISSLTSMEGKSILVSLYSY